MLNVNSPPTFTSTVAPKILSSGAPEKIIENCSRILLRRRIAVNRCPKRRRSVITQMAVPANDYWRLDITDYQVTWHLPKKT
jgi:hypothetical protein